MQLEFVVHDERALQIELERLTGQRIELTITDNSSSLINFREGGRTKPGTLRLHRMFLAASPAIVQAVAKWLTRDRGGRAAAILDTFIDGHGHLVRTKRARRVRLHTSGAHHDLRVVFDELNAREFAGAVCTGITWGRMPTGRRRRHSIRMGSYTPDDDLIRIHPLLDQAFVPAYFVCYIVFHEMLHADIGVERSPSGRCRMHSPEFVRRERLYCDYDRAVTWLDNSRNLARLLRRRP